MRPNRAAAAGVVLLAVSLQITTTLSVGASPLRASAADALLPLGLAAVGTHILISGKQGSRLSNALDQLTRWRLPWWLLATFAALTTLVLFAGIVVGSQTTGSVSQWAVVNKLFGWGALLGYAVLGYLIAHARHAQLFLRTFISFALLIGTATYLAHLLQTGGISTVPVLISSDQRVGGLMSNPSAFGFLVAVVIVLQLADLRDQQLLPRRWHLIGIALGLALILLTGSRSAWIGLAFGVMTLAFLRNLDRRPALLSVAAAIPLIAVALTSRDAINAIAPDPERRALVYLVDADLTSLDHVSIEGRLDQLTHGLRLWSASPWLGIGLGAYIHDDASRGNSPPQHIHNSALWLLTETGLLGATVFGAFFIILAVGLWPTARASSLAPGIFAMLIVFVGVSIGTEAMYQRHVWVILGIGLAATSAIARRDDQAPRV